MSEAKGYLPPGSEVKYPSYYDIPRPAELAEFAELRKTVLEANQKEFIDRISSNPIPDSEELSAGAYRELIEPQCRKAVFEMRRKGYDTKSSGFGTSNSQVVDGYLPLDQAAVDALVHKGFFVYEVGVNSPSIMFRPLSADIEEITHTWDELAALLPDLGTPAPPRFTTRNGFNDWIVRQYAHLGVTKSFFWQPHGSNQVSELKPSSCLDPIESGRDVAAVMR